MKYPYLKRFLKISPFALALWRALEAEAIIQSFVLQELKFVSKKKTFKFRRPLLDLGCGFGEFAGVFFDKQLDVGLDICADDIVTAKKGKKYKKLVVADARKMPLADNTFNTVFSLSVLEHIPNTKKAIQEVYRVLKPGGVFIYTVPTKEINRYLFFPLLFNSIGLDRIGSWYIQYFHKTFKHEELVLPKKWYSWTRNAGFRKISITGTTSKRAIRWFDLTILTAIPSQIGRLLFGSRLIWALPVKIPLLERLFVYIKKDAEIVKGNILVIAQK